MQKKRLIVGLSGASGAMLGERLLMHMQTRNDLGNPSGHVSRRRAHHRP